MPTSRCSMTRFSIGRRSATADLVLVSADRWTARCICLPAGPWREPLTAVRRASIGDRDDERRRRKQRRKKCIGGWRRLRRLFRAFRFISRRASWSESVRIKPRRDRSMALAGKRVRVVASIGDPAAFMRATDGVGRATSAHQCFRIITRLQRAGGGDDRRATRATRRSSCARSRTRSSSDRCWPRLAPPLWYVSQRVTVERGVGGIEHLLDDLVRAHSATSRNAG